MSRASTAERRKNRPLRDQAQAWFDALQRQIAEVEGADAIAAQMKDWKRPEDVMRACPVLVPLLLDLAWRSRKSPAFADLFRTATGEVAEAPSEILALSQKTFDDIVIAHLMGTMRLVCEQRQSVWLAAQQEKRRSRLSRMPVVGAALRGLGLLSPIKTEVLLADYPQKGLYEALKSSFCRREQFALVEVLAMLPTRTVALLGPVPAALDSPAVIRTLAGLDKSSVKTAIEMAEAYVQATVQSPSAPAEGEAADLTAQRAAALSEVLSAGASFLTLAASHQQLVKDAIAKLAPIVASDVWAMCTDPDTLRRIVECPTVIAETLKALTPTINERASIALSEIADPRVAAHAMTVMREKTDLETFRGWIEDETYLTAWRQLAQNLNRIGKLPAEGQRLDPSFKASIKTVCDRGAQVFADIADPPRKTG